MDNSNGAPGTTPADAARRIKEAASHVKDAATTAIDRGREAAVTKVQAAVSEGADRARSSTESTSSALRRAAADLQDDNAWIGTGLRTAADYLEKAGGQLLDGDLNRVADNLNSFARRQPALFLGGSLALGFIIARLGKTALENSSEVQGYTDGEYVPPTTPGVTPGI